MVLIVDLEGKFGCFYHSVLQHPQVWINSRQQCSSPASTMLLLIS